MLRPQNRTAKGPILKDDEILCPSGYIIYLWSPLSIPIMADESRTRVVYSAFDICRPHVYINTLQTAAWTAPAGGEMLVNILYVKGTVSKDVFN